jgi:hypothetical protein
MKAIETTGTVDSERRIVLDEPVAVEGPTRVRLIILLPEDADIGEEEWLKAAARNPAFDFLREPGEDIYTLADGRSFHHTG